MELINISAEPTWKLFGWFPSDLEAEKVVALPDVCPGKSPLPTGTAVLTRQENWRKFAISDCGCGMLLARSSVGRRELNGSRWDRLADAMRARKGKLGDLGGGNHFLDALYPHADGPLHFLIHTGSRNESGHVDHLVDRPKEFDAEFERVTQWATANRDCIRETIQTLFGRLEVILDLPHNTCEKLADGGVIIRKGSVRLCAGDLHVLPSHISGDVVLARGTERAPELLNSMSHGTGRAMARSECKPLADGFDFDDLRRRVLIPAGLTDASLRTEGPYAYRDLDDCPSLLEGYIEVKERFTVVGYMGHL